MGFISSFTLQSPCGVSPLNYSKMLLPTWVLQIASFITTFILLLTVSQKWYFILMRKLLSRSQIAPGKADFVFLQFNQWEIKRPILCFHRRRGELLPLLGCFPSLAPQNITGSQKSPCLTYNLMVPILSPCKSASLYWEQIYSLHQSSGTQHPPQNSPWSANLSC